MEEIVAGIFSSRDEALGVYWSLNQLSSQGAFRLESVAIYARNVVGEFEREVAGVGISEDLAFADSGAGQEAVYELNERAPAGSHVLLLHLTEADPSKLDALISSYGGNVIRRSIGSLESSAGRRYPGE